MDKVIFEKNVVIASITAENVVLTDAKLQSGYFGKWYLQIEDNFTLIASNKESSLILEESVPTEYLTATAGKIVFVSRQDVSKYNDTLGDVEVVPNKLFEDKVALAYHELNRSCFSYFRKLYTEEFNPLKMIKNSYVLRDAICYKIIELVFGDLAVSEEGFYQFNSQKYEHNYKKVLDECLSMILIDKDDDGKIEASEKRESNAIIWLDR